MAEITIQQLIAALLDDSTVFPMRYLNRLSDLSPEEASEIQKVWTQISPRRRTTLLEDLEHIGDADDFLSFEEVGRIALKDELPSVRSLAIRILRSYELPDLILTFLYMMEHDASPEVRAEAAAAMSTFVYMGEIEELSAKKMRGIEDHLIKVITGTDDKLVRRRALEAISFSSRDDVTPLIEQAYAQKDVDWQVSALFAMGRSGDARWKAQVLASLDDSRSAVRAEAASAAGELELKEATKPLLKMLRDEDDEVRAAAIWSLSQIGGEHVAEALEVMLAKTEDDDETELLEDALDNLAFTVDMRNFALLDIPDDETDLNDDDDAAGDEDWEGEEDEGSVSE